MNFKNYLLAFLMLLLVTGVRAQTMVDIHGQLSVDGTKIKDECGRATQLKGMSYFWHQWNGFGAPVSYEYMNREAMRWLRDDWKIEIVRIPIGVRSGDPCTVTGTKVLAPEDGCNGPLGITGKEWAYNTAREAIQAAVDLGLYVIIDWHAHPNEKEAAKEFFRTMSQEFGDNPNVIYEIWNEPIGEFSQGEAKWNEIKAYAEEVIPEIRANDPDNIIVVGTPFYDQFVDVASRNPVTTDVNGNPVSNIAYTLHAYAGSHRQSLRDRANTAISNGLALMMTECGRVATNFGSLDNPVDAAEWDRWEAWMDENDISYCKWSLGNKAETSSSLQLSASVSGNWDYNNDLRSEGQWNRDHFRSVNSSRPTVCDDDGEPEPPVTGDGTIVIRAQGDCGVETMELHVDGTKVDEWTVSTSFADYTYPGFGGGEVSVHFTNDRYGNGDACDDNNLTVDYIEVCGTTYQTEEVATETANCCLDVKDKLYTNGNFNFGALNCEGSPAPASGNVVIRARGWTGSETMQLLVDGELATEWTNVATSATDYTFEGYQGGTLEVVFTNDGNDANGQDRNLAIDYLTVCGVEQQAEQAARSRSCGDTQQGFVWLWCNSSLSFGNPGCSAPANQNQGSNARNVAASAETFRVYPNPTTEELTVAGGNDYQVVLYDLSGRPLMQHHHLRGQATLNVSHLRPGVYLMRVTHSDQHQTSRRIIIE